MVESPFLLPAYILLGIAAVWIVRVIVGLLARRKGRALRELQKLGQEFDGEERCLSGLPSTDQKITR